jgi:hypothetical protein
MTADKKLSKHGNNWWKSASLGVIREKRFFFRLSPNKISEAQLSVLCLFFAFSVVNSHGQAATLP